MQTNTTTEAKSLKARLSKLYDEIDEVESDLMELTDEAEAIKEKLKLLRQQEAYEALKTFTGTVRLNFERDGFKEVEAKVKGPLAICYYRDGWQITHILTGLRVTSCSNYKVAEALLDAAQAFDWTVITEGDNKGVPYETRINFSKLESEIEKELGEDD